MSRKHKTTSDVYPVEDVIPEIAIPEAGYQPPVEVRLTSERSKKSKQQEVGLAIEESIRRKKSDGETRGFILGDLGALGWVILCGLVVGLLAPVVSSGVLAMLIFSAIVFGAIGATSIFYGINDRCKYADSKTQVRRRAADRAEDAFHSKDKQARSASDIAERLGNQTEGQRKGLVVRGPETVVQKTVKRKVRVEAKDIKTKKLVSTVVDGVSKKTIRTPGSLCMFSANATVPHGLLQQIDLSSRGVKRRGIS